MVLIVCGREHILLSDKTSPWGCVLQSEPPGLARWAVCYIAINVCDENK